MKKIFIAAFALFYCGVFAQTFHYKTDYEKVLARTKDKNDALFYDKQVKRFTSNDATLTDYEVLALLIGHSGRPSFDPLKDSFKESIIYELNGDKKYKDASHIADKELKSNPLSLKAIYGKSFALLKLQQKDSAAFYAKQWQKILKAMFLSGKGTALEDPTFSLGQDDGTEFIQMFIGAKADSRKTGQNKNGQFIEIYEATLDQKKITLYFMVDHAVKKMEEAGTK